MESAIQLLVIIVSLTSLLMTLSWVVELFLMKKRWLNFAIGLTIAITTISLLDFILIVYFWPAIVIPITLLGIIIVALSKNRTSKKVFSALAYPLNAILLTIGISLLQSPGTTWGNIASHIGVFCTIETICILQLLTYWVKRNVFYGICKFLVGLVSIAAIALYGFKSSMFTFEFEHFLQMSSIGISISIMLEGLALIFKRNRTCTFS